MLYLKRFRTWLGYVCCAALAMRQEFAGRNNYRIYEREVIEPAAEAQVIESALPESEPGLSPDIQPSVVIESPVAPVLKQTPAALETPALANGKYDPSTINDQTAQRLARLLVSEIKLYYLSATNGEGAGERYIYDLLKEPIDKSRQHYKRRLGKTDAAMPDYFHGELVRSLCAGDASRLGPNYQVRSDGV